MNEAIDWVEELPDIDSEFMQPEWEQAEVRRGGRGHPSRPRQPTGRQRRTAPPSRRLGRSGAMPRRPRPLRRAAIRPRPSRYLPREPLVAVGAEPCTCPAQDCPQHGSEYVRWVQSSLNQIQGLNLPINGIMDAATRSALRRFQEQQRLTVDGIAGPEVKQALIDTKANQSGQGWEAEELDLELADIELEDEISRESQSGAKEPSISNACGGHPVRTTLHVAATYASLASQRLNQLSSLPEDAGKNQWNSGPEKIWFGTYRKNRLINLRNRMWKIVQTLKDPLLVISCDWSKPLFGQASPGIPDITLGREWRDAPRSDIDKVQTIIHEAAHIRGAVLGGELRRKYGIKDAIDRAKDYPGTAIRTAENIGYYATCRASKYNRCP